MTRVDDVIAELGRAVQTRGTTAARLLTTLQARQRIHHRALLTDVLADVSAGAVSALERSYLVDVERAHRLPTARRQRRARTVEGIVFRDVIYSIGSRRLVVELDGRLFHDTTRQRNRDFDRDLIARLAENETVRLSWGQVRGRPCWTAGAIGQLLGSMGWADVVTSCSATCDPARVLRSA